MKKNLEIGQEIKFEQMETPLYFSPMGGFIYQWCCGCNLRHIWHIEIIEEKGKQYIKVDCAVDKSATKLRKFYDRKKKAG